MKTHEFFGKYANVPLAKRGKVLDFNNLGLMTLHDVYVRIKELEDKMRPDRIERDNLLSEVEKFL